MSSAASVSTPLVTVLLPVHNGGDYLHDALASILAQTYPRLDVLVLDDGSTDGAVERAVGALPDPRVRVLRHENRGLPATLNRGIAEARGELIARMDADDVALPDRIRLQVERMDLDPGLVLLGGQLHRLVGEQRGAATAFPLDHDAIVAGLLRRAHVMSHPAVIMRTVAVRDIGGYWGLGTGEDWDLFLRLSEVGRLANLPEPVLDYRFHATGINAESLGVLRRNMAIAVTNHRRRAEGLAPIGPADLRTIRRLPIRITIAAETRSLTHYRRSLREGAAGHRVRAGLALAASAAWWPAQALRRIGRRPSPARLRLSARPAR